jgi:hypothetical protein
MMHVRSSVTAHASDPGCGQADPRMRDREKIQLPHRISEYRLERCYAPKRGTL